MKKFLLICLVIAMAMTSMLASCGEQQGNAETTTKRPDKDNNTVEVWWSANDGGDQDLIDDAWFDFVDLCKDESSEYYAAYGDVADKLTMFTTQGNADDKTALEILIMGNTAPDIARMDHVYITSLGKAGNIFDLQKKFNINTLKDKFIESTWKASSDYTGEAVYGIPFDCNTIIWGGKKTYLDNAGVSLPTTFEEIKSAGAILKNKSSDRSVYTLPCGVDERRNWPVFVFMMYVWRLGGDVLNTECTEAIFNNPETGVRALEMMKELREAGLVSTTAYEEGESILCDYGTWRLDSITDDMEFSLLPELKAGVPRYSGLGLYNLTIVSTSLNPQLAYDFAIHFATGVNSLTNEHYQYTFAKSHMLLPPLKAAGEEDDFDNEAKKAFWQQSLEQLELCKWRPMVAEWYDIQDELWKAIDRVLNGGANPTDSLNTAAAAVNAKLR